MIFLHNHVNALLGFTQFPTVGAGWDERIIDREITIMLELGIRGITISCRQAILLKENILTK
jgi:hypothetical protein